MDAEPLHAGDPRHPDRDAWLLEFGRASYQAARVAGIAFDVLRIFGDHESSDLYRDVLGSLVAKLREVPVDRVPGIEEFIVQIDQARIDRNDLIHALPVAHGLQRRKSDDPMYVRNFYDVEDLEAVTAVLDATSHQGNVLLYQDGGAAIRAWYARA
jgi:hypothetical protein